jgi:hypothetical protein
MLVAAAFKPEPIALIDGSEEFAAMSDRDDR